MPRTDLTKTTPLGGYPTLPLVADSADAVFTAADVGNKNQFTFESGDLVLAWNSGASPYTVTLTSIADARKRTGDVTAYSLAAGDVAVFGPFDSEGWRQADGKFYLEASNTAVKFAIIRKV
jgi:hypothetical protein